MEHRICTLAACPELRGEVDRVHEATWPRFVLEGHSPDGTLERWYPLLDQFAEYQLVLTDARGDLIAAGHTIPLRWDETVEGLPEGWGGTVVQGFRGREEAIAPNTLVALGIAVHPTRRGQGVATQMLLAMKSLAVEHELNSLIAPVRPNWKERYPLTAMQRYVQWTRADGSPFDPWIRSHWKIGARPLAVAERSMIVMGSVSEWESWTGLTLPDSGQYTIPGALVPIQVDRENDWVCYEEPNYWMKHPLP
ncbi:MAG TPA: GNAT family N-acetyltransferase [Tepidisphaeraceae bacterium]|nr:GNAT family N-acetyltransferase [Tepidisphaeraceae bacterium]